MQRPRSRASSLLVLAAALHCCSSTPAKKDPPGTTTFYVVRHAERANDNDDSPLSKAGFARAKALAMRLRGVKLDAVYATRYQRTQATVAPTAARLGLTVQKATPSAQELLARHRGGAVLIAGHSNTVPELLRELGVKDNVEIGHHDYGDLFVVRVHDGSATLTRDTFGPRPPG